MARWFLPASLKPILTGHSVNEILYSTLSKTCSCVEMSMEIKYKCHNLCNNIHKLSKGSLASFEANLRGYTCSGSSKLHKDLIKKV